jgi:hypothetical protein
LAWGVKKKEEGRGEERRIFAWEIGGGVDLFTALV